MTIVSLKFNPLTDVYTCEEEDVLFLDEIVADSQQQNQ
jgi:hypothetical protein